MKIRQIRLERFVILHMKIDDWFVSDSILAYLNQMTLIA